MDIADSTFRHFIVETERSATLVMPIEHVADFHDWLTSNPEWYIRESGPANPSTLHVRKYVIYRKAYL